METAFDRIAGICKSATADLATEHEPIRAQEIVREATNQVFNGSDIQTRMLHTNRVCHLPHFILAPNHPTIKEGHKISIEGLNQDWAVPTWAFFVRQCLEQLELEHRYLAPHSFTQFREKLEAIGVFGCREDGVNLVDQMNTQLGDWIERRDHFATVIAVEDHSHGKGNIGTPLRRGAFQLAKENQIPVVPARIDGFDDPGEISEVSLTFGSSIEVSPDQRINRDFLQRVAEKSYHDQLDLTLTDRR